MLLQGANRLYTGDKNHRKQWALRRLLFFHAHWNTHPILMAPYRIHQLRPHFELQLLQLPNENFFRNPGMISFECLRSIVSIITGAKLIVLLLPGIIIELSF